MTKYDKLSRRNQSIYYEVLEDGFKIYIGQTIHADIHQYEPYIPDPSKTYEENAIEMCESLCTVNDSPSVDDRLTNLESNVDYLMLLNDSTDE